MVGKKKKNLQILHSPNKTDETREKIKGKRAGGWGKQSKGQKLSLAKIISQLIMLYTLHYNRYVKADTQRFNWTEQNNS
jgi:hypothetical protein